MTAPAPQLTSDAIAAAAGAVPDGPAYLQDPNPPYAWFPIRSTKPAAGGGIVVSAAAPVVDPPDPPPVTVPVQPNEPAGNVMQTYRPCAALLEGTWTNTKDETAVVLADRTVGSCIAIPFPAGSDYTAYPFQQQVTFAAPNRNAFVRWEWLVGLNWVQIADVLKGLYVTSAPRTGALAPQPSHALSMVGIGSQGLYPQLRTQCTQSSGLAQNLGPSSLGSVIARGVWTALSFAIRLNTPGHADGSVTISVDDQPVYTSDTVESYPAADPTTGTPYPQWLFQGLQWVPIFGGVLPGNPTTPAVQTLRYAQIYASTGP
jgi:hypothetical protein